MITKLPQDIISKIAAGEVITSPFNVIKECIENSIDANSGNITVDISKDCLTFKITDDGDGIERDDFTLLCERNCTSKLNDDLLSIPTFGFRGEALSSISLVSKITVESKKINQLTGYFGTYQDCRLIALKERAMNKGTCITISELFYNNSYRKGYFYRRKDEINKIYHLIANYAICYTNIKFVMLIDNNLKEDFNMKFKPYKPENLFSLFSRTFTNIEAKKDIIQNIYKLDNELLISKDSQFLALYTNINCNFRQYTFILFINGRLVNNFTIKERVKRVYSAFLPKNRFPFIFIELYIDNHSVDVNVHPSKKEVICDNEGLIIDKIISSIKDGFSNNVCTIKQKIPQIVDNEIKEKMTQILYADPNASSIIDLFSDRSIEPKYKKIYKLKTLNELKMEFGDTHAHFMKGMVYVGEFDHRTIIQDEFNLVLFDIDTVLETYFYQRLLFDIGNNKTIAVRQNIKANLSDRHIKLLEIYFNTKIRSDVIEEILTIDRIDLSMEIEEFLIKFTNYEMINEKETFVFILKELSTLFKKNYVKGELNFNLLKKNILYREEYGDTFRILTSVQQLYKLFDRC